MFSFCAICGYFHLHTCVEPIHERRGKESPPFFLLKKKNRTAVPPTQKRPPKKVKKKEKALFGLLFSPWVASEKNIYYYENLTSS
jgi:hypothetical protein